MGLTTRTTMFSRDRKPTVGYKGDSRSISRRERWLSCERRGSRFRPCGRKVCSAVAPQKLLDGFCRDRLGVQVALSQLAPDLLEQVHLRLCFDAFRNHLQAETMSEHHDNANDFAGFEIGVHARDESAIDLQRVYRKPL